MRRSLSRLILAFCLFFTSQTIPSRSNAMIALGGTTLGVSWLVAAVVVGAAAGGSTMLVEKVKSKIAKGGLIAVAVILGLGAAVLLDESQEGTVVWTDLTPDQAKALGNFSSDSVDEYNEILPALNATQESLVVSVKKILKEKPESTEQEIKNYIAEGWQSAYGQLKMSPEAIQIHKKVATQAFADIKK